MVGMQTDIHHELLISSLRDYLPRSSAFAASVSAWSVGQQIEHCGKAMVGICDAVIDSTPPMPQPAFSLQRFILLTTGWIPRGRAKAPDSVLPSENSTLEHLEALLDRSVQRIEQVEALTDSAWFDHPILGPMSRKTTLKFLRIHNHHHLKLIRDILKATDD